MAVSIERIAQGVALAGTIAGMAYTALAIARVRAFRRTCANAPRESGVGISILKPLRGLEPQLFENLCSFCDQDYDTFEVIFGAADAGDPALDVARAVAQRFPHRNIRVIGGNARAAANPKIGNLLGLVDHAQYPILLIADSDILVTPQYLGTVAAAFDGGRIGAATCIYGGVPIDRFAARMGALHVNDEFAPSVLVAAALEPLTYCFGATMAVRREVLDRIGGLQAVGTHVGDDYLLGRLVTSAGYRVALVPYVVQTVSADETLSQLWQHELRWSRTIFMQRPAGYAGSIVTYALPWGIAYALLARTPLAFALLAGASALRLFLHVQARELFASKTRSPFWMLALRDVLGVALWSATFFGKRVHWKDHAYRVNAGGRMAVGPEEV